MVYPESWQCPSCGTIVTNAKECNICNYEPPAESGGLNTKTKKEEKTTKLLKKRVAAFLIDLGIIIGMGLIMSLIIVIIFSANSSKGLGILFSSFGIPITLVFVALHPAYFILLEGMYGQTYGKRALKIKVYNEGGMTYQKSLLRNITRFVEMIILYIPSLILIAKTGKSVGDRIAGTQIIKQE